jgi:RNA polymerase sigma factor (sigma-70 family)
LTKQYFYSYLQLVVAPFTITSYEGDLMLRTIPLSDEELAAAHAVLRRDLNLCRTALYRELGAVGVPVTTIPESLQAHAGVYQLPTLKKMDLDGRVEYFLSRRPMHLLRVHVDSHAAARFKALWNYHLPLCYFFARRYENILRVAHSELVSHTSEGLMQALARFDRGKGVFSTYATYWMVQSIHRDVLREKRPMHIPYGALLRAGMPDATPEEAVVLRYRKCALDTPLQFEDLAASLGITPFRAAHGLLPVMTRQDLIPDPRAEEAYGAQCDERDNARMMEELINDALTPFERVVLDARLQEPAPSYKEIGVAYNLSRERIRQVHNKALCKLRKRLQRFCC